MYLPGAVPLEDVDSVVPVAQLYQQAKGGDDGQGLREHDLEIDLGFARAVDLCCLQQGRVDAR